MLVMLFTWEFWTRPEFLSYLGIQSGAETDENALSAEDRAIGVDIDTLPLLLNDVGISANPANPDQSAAAKSATQSTNLANLQGIPIAGSAPSQSTPGLFGNLSNAPTPLQRFGLPNSTNNPGNNLGGQEPSPSNQMPFATQQQIFSANNNLLNPSSTPSPLPQSPLQSALANAPNSTTVEKTAENQLPLTPSSFTSIPTPGTPIEGTTSLGNFGVNATTPNNAPPPNSFTNLVEGSQPISGSESSLSGVTPAVPTIVPSVPSSAIPLNSGQPIPQGLGASPDAFAPRPSTEVIPPNNLPLSAPRPIPGRFIGGGQINTFSNP
jgi:hypothetical protein